MLCQNKKSSYLLFSNFLIVDILLIFLDLWLLLILKWVQFQPRLHLGLDFSMNLTHLLSDSDSESYESSWDKNHNCVHFGKTMKFYQMMKFSPQNFQKNMFFIFDGAKSCMVITFLRKIHNWYFYTKTFDKLWYIS